MPLKDFVVGEGVRLRFTFKKLDETTRKYIFADPGDVKISYTDPDDNTVQKDYPSGSDIVRDDVGIYRLDLVATLHGDWLFRCVGTIGLNAAFEGKFTVRKTSF